MVKTTSIPTEYIKQHGASNAATAVGTDANSLLDGQPYLQKGESGQGFRRSLWIWNSTSQAWDCYPFTPIQGTAAPSGSVTPDTIGQGFLDNTNGNYYIATGTTSSDWLLTN